MDLNFVDIRDNDVLAHIEVKEGDALLSLTLTQDLKLSRLGSPDFRIYPNKVISFGVERIIRQEIKNRLLSMSGQAFLFTRQNPDWKIRKLIRPISYVTPDEALAAALLEEEYRDEIILHGSKLHALIFELTEWNANRYNFVSHFGPSLLNAVLNEYPYPFKDLHGRTRLQSALDLFGDMMEWFTQNLSHIEPVERIFPPLKYDCIYTNQISALVLVGSEKFGAEDLIAQMHFQANPILIRLVLVKKVPQSTKYLISVINKNTYDSSLIQLPHPSIKELNSTEKHLSGDPGWKNVKGFVRGPNKGSCLALETIWNLCKLPEQEVGSNLSV
jgi:hypothetical protein